MAINLLKIRAKVNFPSVWMSMVLNIDSLSHLVHYIERCSKFALAKSRPCPIIGARVVMVAAWGN